MSKNTKNILLVAVVILIVGAIWYISSRKNRLL